ncbi:MAG: hypothetical protein ABW292_16320, partial [Vicinamibacterales bacterium]
MRSISADLLRNPPSGAVFYCTRGRARSDRRGTLGRSEQKRLVAQDAAEPRLALAPGLEVLCDRGQQLGLVR